MNFDQFILYLGSISLAQWFVVLYILIMFICYIKKIPKVYPYTISLLFLILELKWGWILGFGKYVIGSYDMFLNFIGVVLSAFISALAVYFASKPLRTNVQIEVNLGNYTPRDGYRHSLLPILDVYNYSTFPIYIKQIEFIKSKPSDISLEIFHFKNLWENRKLLNKMFIKRFLFLNQNLYLLLKIIISKRLIYIDSGMSDHQQSIKVLNHGLHSFHIFQDLTYNKEDLSLKRKSFNNNIKLGQLTDEEKLESLDLINKMEKTFKDEYHNVLDIKIYLTNGKVLYAKKSLIKELNKLLNWNTPKKININVNATLGE